MSVHELGLAINRMRSIFDDYDNRIINLTLEAQALESKVTKAVGLLKSPKLKDYKNYKCVCESMDELGCWDCKNTGFLTSNERIISNCIEVEKTLEEIGEVKE